MKTTIGSKEDTTKETCELEHDNSRRKEFEHIVRQYGEQLYWKIRRIVLIHEDANDILQNTFLKAWNAFPDFQNKSKVSTWLYRIAINESLDFLRKRQNSVRQEDNMSIASKLVADEYFNGNEAQALLQEAIATLPDTQKAVFTMRYYDEMKYSELSKVLATSEGALKASYHIAIKKISEYVLNHFTQETSNHQKNKNGKGR
ncbi:MAG: RNA polymerase sigma factor [Prevotella sp.]|nr:RNA polymerase sigma factor [Prevotella sp.]